MSKHESIPVNMPVEMINVTPINPLISKCQIKVCYVGEEPNRNGTIITKDVARELANSLPGSPIVGFFNESKEDFEEHNWELKLQDGEIKFESTTRPYGFVDLGAKVWFQKFLDDGVEHEYLVTEGYLWTGQYPEAQRVIEKGNNQSMELDERFVEGSWTDFDNNGYSFFIINEAIISKLCILGEEVEPCFEGAQITKVQYSFDESFKNKLFALMNEVKQVLDKGGVSVNEDNKLVEEEVLEEQEPISEDPVSEEAEVPEDTNVESEPAAEGDEPETEFADKDDEEEVCPKCGKPLDECTCDEDEDKKEKFSLNEIPEYVELKNSYDSLKADYDTLKAERDALCSFKAKIDKEQKQAMIDSFYMLSDSDKKDVIENIDTYSLDDIEAKLSIICVRNKVNFSLDDDDDKEGVMTYSLNSDDADDSVPAWVAALRETAKENNK